MSKRANPAVIGVFVVGAIVLAVVGIFIFGTGEFLKQRHKFILYFEESVNGLEEGASVKFKGVEIGRVSDVLIHFDDVGGNAYIPVVIEIDSMDLPTKNGTGFELYKPDVFDQQVKNGLRAKLEYKSYFTGLLFVELDYLPEEPPKLVAIESDFRQIPTVGSELNELWSAATEMFMNFKEIDFKGIADNIGSIADKIDSKLDDIDLEQISVKMIAAMDSLQSVSSKVDKHIDPVAEEALAAFKQAKEAFIDIEGASESISDVIEENSPFRQQWDETLEEIGDAARSIRRLADFLERNPRALLTGKKLPGTN